MANAKRGARVHRLGVDLLGAKPPIWRRVEVPSEWSLADLHAVIQAVFGWEGCHLWAFDMGGRPRGANRYGMSGAELDIGDAATKSLAQVARRAGRKFTYTYDFGDDWDHGIVVESIGPAEPGVAYPRCLAGRRACPPEDCGGVWGYAALLEALADPEHERHDDMMDWLGLDSPGDFDPAAFDLATADAALAKYATVPVQD